MKKELFNRLCSDLFTQLSSNEHLSLEFRGEESFFLRFNHGKVRQNTEVIDGDLYFNLVADQRNINGKAPVTGNWETDAPRLRNFLQELQTTIKTLPLDPMSVKPQDFGKSSAEIKGKILSASEVADAIFTEVGDMDMTGIYAGGTLFRATANSVGTEHWFAVDNFNLDYSLISPSEKMAKGNFSGSEWQQKQFMLNRSNCQNQLAALERPVKKVTPGKYMTYLAPGAIHEIIGLMSYQGFSTKALKQRQSPWLRLVDGKAELSPRFTLRENFSLGLNTPFNELGETTQELLPLIEKGHLVDTLTNQRSAKEFSLPSNGADAHEMLRSPEILPGKLVAKEALGQMKEGLYLNQLHYLNWSEINAARFTGMTRYACFWVENGEWIAPIENLRFDDSVYEIFGSKLVDFTSQAETFTESTTYERRQLGGAKAPGALISEMHFKL